MAHTGAQLSGSGAQLSGSGAQLSGPGAQLSAISAYLHTSYLGAQLSASRFYLYQYNVHLNDCKSDIFDQPIAKNNSYTHTSSLNNGMCWTDFLS